MAPLLISNKVGKQGRIGDGKPAGPTAPEGTGLHEAVLVTARTVVNNHTGLQLSPFCKKGLTALKGWSYGLSLGRFEDLDQFMDSSSRQVMHEVEPEYAF